MRAQQAPNSQNIICSNFFWSNFVTIYTFGHQTEHGNLEIVFEVYIKEK